MASVSLFVFFFIAHLVLLHSAEEEGIYPPNCPPFLCGKLGKIGFPFSTSPECGLCILYDCGNLTNKGSFYDTVPKIQLERNGTLYDIESISQADTIKIKDQQLQHMLDSRDCESLNNFTLPSSPFISFQITPNLTLFKCNRTLNVPHPIGFNTTNCSNYNIYYSHLRDNSTMPPTQCPIIQLPLNWETQSNELFGMLSADIFLQVRVSFDCRKCFVRGGQCKTDNSGKYYCSNAMKGIGIGIIQKIFGYALHTFMKSHINLFIFRL
jgi:hypothetical protein